MKQQLFDFMDRAWKPAPPPRPPTPTEVEISPFVAVARAEGGSRKGKSADLAIMVRLDASVPWQEDTHAIFWYGCSAIEKATAAARIVAEDPRRADGSNRYLEFVESRLRTRNGVCVQGC